MITPEKLAILAARPGLPEDIRDALSDASVQLSNSSVEQTLLVERAAAVARRHRSKVQINEPL